MAERRVPRAGLGAVDGQDARPQRLRGMDGGGRICELLTIYYIISDINLLRTSAEFVSDIIFLENQ